MEEAKKILFTGQLGIEYGQYYIDVADDEDDEEYLVPELAFEGHENGICGAALDGRLFLVTGPQDGTIAIQLELHDAAPPIDESYEEIVEVSLQRKESPLSLCEWAHETTHALDLPPGTYRVRYSIDQMGKEHDEDGDWEAPVPGQRHLLQLWPGEHRADRILKQTSEIAAYWHREWGSGG